MASAPALAPTQDPTVVVLEGPLTIATSEAVRDAILAALSASGGVVLDCGGASQVDVTFLQIALAAAQTAATRGTPLAFAAEPSGALAQALARGGFTPDAAGTDRPDAIFWRKAS